MSNLVQIMKHVMPLVMNTLPEINHTTYRNRVQIESNNYQAQFAFKIKARNIICFTYVQLHITAFKKG
jgi:hypothetical protein